MIDLEDRHLKLIKAILQAHVPGIEVRAFGSRVNGEARPYSDLDLVVVGEEAVAGSTIASLKDAFSESNLPIMIDVLDWHVIGDRFRALLEQAEFQILQEPA